MAVDVVVVVACPNAHAAGYTIRGRGREKRTARRGCSAAFAACGTNDGLAGEKVGGAKGRRRMGKKERTIFGVVDMYLLYLLEVK